MRMHMNQLESLQAQELRFRFGKPPVGGGNLQEPDGEIAAAYEMGKRHAIEMERLKQKWAREEESERGYR